MTYLYVEYDGSDINAFNVTINRMIDSVDSASFQLESIAKSTLETWDARIDDEINIYESGADTLLFSGVILSIDLNEDDTALTIVCNGRARKLSWYGLNPSETNGRFNNEDYIVYETPEGTSLKFYTTDETDPVLTSNECIGKFIIVSDDTLEESSLEYDLMEVAVSNCTVTSETNDESSTEDNDGTFHTLEIDGSDVSNNPFQIKYRYHIGNISSDDEILRLQYSWYGRIDNDFVDAVTFDNVNISASFYWSHDGTTKGKHLKTLTILPNEDPVYVSVAIEFTDNDGNMWFTEGVDTYDNGYVILELTTRISGVNTMPPTQVASECKIECDYTHLKVDYDTVDFDTINQKISTYTAGSGYDTIRAYDNDTPPVANNFDFAAAGVRIDDVVVIGVDYFYQFQNCMKAIDLDYEVNGGALTGVGNADSYVGLNALQYWKELCNKLQYTYFTKYSDGDLIFTAISESDITAASVTYSTDVDPPSSIKPRYENTERYGKVKVYWRGGVASADVSGQAGKPWVNKEKIIVEQSTITTSEAQSIADQWAAYYGTTHYAIECVWDYYPTNLPQPGTKYSLTIPKSGGTISYSDLICRRLSITKNSQSQWNIFASFGGSSSPPAERSGKMIATIKHDLDVMKTIQVRNGVSRTFTSYSDAQARASINNIYGSDGKADSNIDMDSHKFTSVAVATANGEVLRYDDLAAAGLVDNAIDTLIATHEAAAGAHADTTETLTNKTLTSPKINEDVALTSTATELNLLDGFTEVETTLTDSATKIPNSAAIYTYKVKITKDDAQSIGSGAYTKIQYDDEDLDPAGCWESNEYTVPVDGDYWVHASLRMGSVSWATGERFILRVYIDPGTGYASSDVLSDYEQPVTNTEEKSQEGSTLLTGLSTGDKIAIYVYQNTGGNVNIKADDPYNRVVIWRVP